MAHGAGAVVSQRATAHVDRGVTGSTGIGIGHAVFQCAVGDQVAAFLVNDGVAINGFDTQGSAVPLVVTLPVLSMVAVPLPVDLADTPWA